MNSLERRRARKIRQDIANMRQMLDRAEHHLDDPETHDGAVTAADRPPRVGDQITTAAQLDALPAATYFKCQCDYHGTKIGDDLYLTGVRKHSRADMVENHLPVTVLYMPGEPSCPSVTDNARADVLAAHQVESRGATASTPDRCTCGEAVPPEPDPTTEGLAVPIEVRRRRAFAAHQARALAAGRAETTTEQPCRHCGSCDGPPSCPDCDHADRRAETTTATTEDAARVLDDVIQHLRKIWPTGHDEAREVIDTAEELLAQALPRLLVTARTHPTREQIDHAVGEVLSNASNHPDPVAVLGRSIAPLRNKITDAVLELLTDHHEDDHR